MPTTPDFMDTLADCFQGCVGSLEDLHDLDLLPDGFNADRWQESVFVRRNFLTQEIDITLTDHRWCRHTRSIELTNDLSAAEVRRRFKRALSDL